MNIISSTSYGCLLIAAAAVAAFDAGMAGAVSDESSVPQPHSDRLGVVVTGFQVSARDQVTAKTHELVATTEGVVSDSWITTQVKSEILADSVTKGLAVSVDTSTLIVAEK